MINANIGKKTRYPERIIKQPMTERHREQVKRYLTQRKYPWEEWSDGSWWFITRGVDFSSELDPFEDMIDRMHMWGIRNGMRLQAFVTDNRKSIVFQYYTGSKRPLSQTRLLKQQLRDLSRA